MVLRRISGWLVTSSSTVCPAIGLFPRSRTVTVNRPAGSATPFFVPTRRMPLGAELFAALMIPCGLSFGARFAAEPVPTNAVVSARRRAVITTRWWSRGPRTRPSVRCDARDECSTIHVRK